MLITVPLIIYGISIFAKLIGKYPIILLFGGGLLGWVAGEISGRGPILMPYVQGEELFFKIGTVGAALH